MEFRLIEERDMSIDEYLDVFDPESADYALIKTRSERLSRIIIRKLEDPSGRVVEDTTFVEKTGIQYTVRSNL